MTVTNCKKTIELSYAKKSVDGFYLLSKNFVDSVDCIGQKVKAYSNMPDYCFSMIFM